MLAIKNGQQQNISDDLDEDENNKPKDPSQFGHEIQHYLKQIHNKKDEIVDPELIRIENSKKLRKLVKK